MQISDDVIYTAGGIGIKNKFNSNFYYSLRKF